MDHTRYPSISLKALAAAVGENAAQTEAQLAGGATALAGDASVMRFNAGEEKKP